MSKVARILPLMYPKTFVQTRFKIGNKNNDIIKDIYFFKKYLLPIISSIFYYTLIFYLIIV